MATQKKTLDDVKNKSLLRHKGLINGSWVDSSSSKSTFDVVDPATLDVLATLPEMDRHDAALAVDAAFEAFKTFKKTSARSRARLLRKWSDLCIENADDLALIMTLENGKPLPEAKGEVVYGASFLEWFATQAEMVHGEVVPPANLGQRIVTFKQPIGVAACLAPWNFPIVSLCSQEPFRLMLSQSPNHRGHCSLVTTTTMARDASVVLRWVSHRIDR